MYFVFVLLQTFFLVKGKINIVVGDVGGPQCWSSSVGHCVIYPFAVITLIWAHHSGSLGSHWERKSNPVLPVNRYNTKLTPRYVSEWFSILEKDIVLPVYRE